MTKCLAELMQIINPYTLTQILDLWISVVRVWNTISTVQMSKPRQEVKLFCTSGKKCGC